MRPSQNKGSWTIRRFFHVARRTGRPLARTRGASPARSTSNGAFARQTEERTRDQGDRRGVGDEIPIQLGRRHPRPRYHRTHPDNGISYVIIGTAAVKNPGFLHDACSAFPGQIIVGLDARMARSPLTAGRKMTGHDVIDLAKKCEDYGVEGIIYTDIGRDGMLTGINIDATVARAVVAHSGDCQRRPVQPR